MNAGAYSGEIAGVTESVEVMEPDGRCRVYNRKKWRSAIAPAL